MKHDEVVAALNKIAANGKLHGLSTEEVKELKNYNLIAINAGEEKNKTPTYILTKKGRVMHKANNKSAAGGTTQQN